MTISSLEILKLNLQIERIIENFNTCYLEGKITHILGQKVINDHEDIYKECLSLLEVAEEYRPSIKEPLNLKIPDNLIKLDYYWDIDSFLNIVKKSVGEINDFLEKVSECVRKYLLNENLSDEEKLFLFGGNKIRSSNLFSIDQESQVSTEAFHTCEPAEESFAMPDQDMIESQNNLNNKAMELQKTINSLNEDLEICSLEKINLHKEIDGQNEQIIESNKFLGKKDDEILQLNDEIDDFESMIEVKDDFIKELHYEINKVEYKVKESMQKDFTFNGVNNLLKNIHIFDEKVYNAKKKSDEKKNNKQQTNFAKNCKNSTNNLELLFSSNLDKQEKITNIPDDLSFCINNLSSRFADFS